MKNLNTQYVKYNNMMYEVLVYPQYSKDNRICLCTLFGSADDDKNTFRTNPDKVQHFKGRRVSIGIKY